MPTIHPCLWFDDRAEEAAELYTALFPNSRITEISRYGEGTMGEPGKVMVANVELDGRPLMLLNGGPMFTPNEAVSLVVTCADQEEMDHYWYGLIADGGEESQCGWLKDKFGFSWQIVPKDMGRYLGGDPQKSARAFAAMMQMRRLDLAALLAAREG